MDSSDAYLNSQEGGLLGDTVGRATDSARNVGSVALNVTVVVVFSRGQLCVMSNLKLANLPAKLAAKEARPPKSGWSTSIPVSRM